MVIKNKGLISVIVPVFGNFDSTRVEMCIDSIKSQKHTNAEIIVVEQTKEPRLNEVRDISYQHIPIAFSEDGFFVPGNVRNYAAKMAVGEFLYNTDGDILFFKDNYLAELVKLLGGDSHTCLYQPQMRRLPIENFEEFRKRCQEGGLQNALFALNISQPYSATYDTCPVRIRYFKKMISGQEEISVASETDHQKYLSGANKGKEPFFYTLNFHAGGILMSRNQFDAVGGYCEDYAGWGCHDEDIQWKLGSLFNLQRIPKEKGLEVLHLDHPRPYFSEVRWNKNREIQKDRMGAGVGSAIISDQRRQNGTR